MLKFVGKGSKKINFSKVRLSLSEKKKEKIVNQIFLLIRWFLGHIYTILKYIKKKTQKNIYLYNILWNYKKMRPPRHLVKLSVLKVRLGIIDIDPQLNSLKTK